MSVDELYELIKKANRFIDSSELLFNTKDYDSAVSRTYYAMFFSAEALLLTIDLAPKSHSGLISLFGEKFI
ncbi:MAG: HEPN domain-containing protein [Candidatus Lokiarchaeota archaeon]|nr:HEPN domain-containing protein [Candidatus Lokiarchaeota archaeon]